MTVSTRMKGMATVFDSSYDEIGSSLSGMDSNLAQKRNKET